VPVLRTWWGLSLRPWARAIVNIQTEIKQMFKGKTSKTIESKTTEDKPVDT